MAKRKRTKKSRAQNEPVTKNKTGTIALLVIVGIVAVMAYATLGLKNPGTNVGGDLQLPSYAYVSARSEQSYRVSLTPAIQERDVFSKIPCYCGCVGVGHESLKDCFLDDHGSFCDICQFEALETYDMVNKGLSLGEIRAAIDNRYGNSGPGTKTPPVL